MIQILIVDDEKPICDLIQMSLTRAGYHCTCVYDGLAAADILERNVFDLILLDVMLPNADGFELMEYIRPLGIPVIFLTARGSVDDRVRGLRMGAEDYIVKPFEVVELLARVDVVLRRYNKTDAVIDIGGLRIDTRAMQVWRGTEEISLTHKEYDLLLFFARNPGTALYRETIYGIGGSLMIAQSFSSSIDRERDAAVQTYRMVVDVLDLLGDNASPGTAANTVALVLHKLGSGGSSTAARIRFGAQMTTTGDTALLDEAPEPPAGSGVTSIVHTGNGRHYLMLGATADGTTVQLAFDVTETYTVRQTQQRAYHTTFVILIAIGAAVAWVTSYLLTRPLGTLSRASRELARGNLGYRAPVRSRDEVGQLASDFNRMAGQLERNVNRIQETMALQERFMADFSHEMKTPMTSIIGYADLLRSQVLTPDEQMDAANYIFSEGKRLEALGLKLLDMLSLDQSKLQLVPAHPADLVAGLLEHLKRLYAQKGIALQYRTEEGACFLEPDLFKTLLVNLMDNARKALDSGGNIYVWQEMLPDGCRVRVLDNGRGIPPEALAHLTEAFYRVDKSRSRAQGGAGLGLSLCNEIVQLHGGTMQFESRVGNGTVVTVELKGGRV